MILFSSKSIRGNFSSVFIATVHKLQSQWFDSHFWLHVGVLEQDTEPTVDLVVVYDVSLWIRA